VYLASEGGIWTKERRSTLFFKAYSNFMLDVSTLYVTFPFLSERKREDGEGVEGRVVWSVLYTLSNGIRVEEDGKYMAHTLI
jgi:hypothetical protein